MKRLIILVISALFICSCSESIEPTPVAPKQKQAFEQNATDAAGVAEGDEQVSPFGKPAR
jgi:PBP1b-binding outer membrane lipoprotein LpoB